MWTLHASPVIRLLLTVMLLQKNTVNSAANLFSQTIAILDDTNWQSIVLDYLLLCACSRLAAQFRMWMLHASLVM